MQEEKMREYLRKFTNRYITACDKANLPSNREMLENIIDSAKIDLLDMKGTSGTFCVNENYIGIIINNYMNNGEKRNEFLLLHEYTHLSSGLNKEAFSDRDSFSNELCARAARIGGEYITGTEAFYGYMALDEVLAQWTCEELNNPKRETKKYNMGPLHAKVVFNTTFTSGDRYDIYSPLEEPAQKVLKLAGYSSIRDLAVKVLGAREGLGEVSDEIFKNICYLGVICHGIYEEQEFEETETISKKDIEKAYRLLGFKPRGKVLKNN